MAISRQVDLLEPINLADHLDKVELYLGQVCQIAGISKMQLDYWTNKAQIPTKGKKQRIYDADAIETVLLIKQGKDKGMSLAAVPALRQEQREQVDRRREDDRRRGRRGDLDQGLQVAQLQRDRMGLDHDGGILEPLRGLVFALGRDHLRAALALGLRLTGHRP